MRSITDTAKNLRFNLIFPDNSQSGIVTHAPAPIVGPDYIVHGLYGARGWRRILRDALIRGLGAAVGWLRLLRRAGRGYHSFEYPYRVHRQQLPGMFLTEAAPIPPPRSCLLVPVIAPASFRSAVLCPYSIDQSRPARM